MKNIGSKKELKKERKGKNKSPDAEGRWFQLI